VHYHAATRRGPDVHTREGVLRGEVAELIHHFFHGEHDWILQKFSAGQ
jgi:hypothetical protein